MGCGDRRRRSGRARGRPGSRPRRRPDDRARTRDAPPLQDVRRRPDRRLATPRRLRTSPSRPGRHRLASLHPNGRCRSPAAAAVRARCCGWCSREEFDDALRAAAVEAGAVVRERTHRPRGRRSMMTTWSCAWPTASTVAASVVIGADGSSGVVARHVGVDCAQVDLGLEVELPVPPSIARRWRDRLLHRLGPDPRLVRLGLPEGRHADGRRDRGPGHAARRPAPTCGGSCTGSVSPASSPTHDSGHLTRCRADVVAAAARPGDRRR